MSQIKISQHALERFIERQDDTVMAYANKTLESPEEALVVLKQMLEDSRPVSVKKAVRNEMRAKYHSAGTYRMVENWMFIVEERESSRNLVTCYPMSEAQQERKLKD